jgi:hypothetical protein
MNTTENNQLIASFLGQTSTIYEFPQFGYIKSNGDWKDTFSASELKFHKDWNWLMEVVEKINNTGRFEVIIQYGFCYVTDGDGELTLSCPAKNTIYAVYSAVVEFIEWYNKQNK